MGYFGSIMLEFQFERIYFGGQRFSVVCGDNISVTCSINNSETINYDFK